MYLLKKNPNYQPDNLPSHLRLFDLDFLNFYLYLFIYYYRDTVSL